MSKRLQVLMPDDEYRALVTAARRRGQPVARLVRDSLRQTIALEAGQASRTADRVGAALRSLRRTDRRHLAAARRDRARTRHPVIYVDSNVPMYLVGADHPHKHRVVELVPQCCLREKRSSRVPRPSRRSSTAIWPIRDRVHLNAAYDALEAMVVSIADVRKEDVDRARTLSADHPSLSSRDCLHVSVMRRLDCARIWSYDSSFDLVPSVLRIQ